MFYWFYEFRNGRTCFEDEKRTSGPSAAVTPENVAAVELMVREDCRITNDALQKTGHRIGSSQYHSSCASERQQAINTPMICLKSKKVA